MLQLLIDGDFRKLRQFWFETCPSMPQPENDEQAEIAMHQARTACGVLPKLLRLWSHRWLQEREIQSMLPFELTEEANQMQPTIVRTVGLSFATTSPELEPVMNTVREMVETQVMDLMSGQTIPDSDVIRKAIEDTRKAAVKKLLG